MAVRIIAAALLVAFGAIGAWLAISLTQRPPQPENLQQSSAPSRGQAAKPELPASQPVSATGDAIATGGDHALDRTAVPSKGSSELDAAVGLPTLPEALTAGESPAMLESSPFRYSMKRDAKLCYSYQTEVSDGIFKRIIKGRLHFGVSDKPLREVLPPALAGVLDNAKKTAGNGSGFLVHPDGLLVTCAHVVEGLSEVDVEFGGRTVTGRVVLCDGGNDLALVKLPVSGVRFLRIQPTTPGLGAAARVFGFPLTDQLGSSMKLTTGTVSGIDQLPAGKRIQLDATANPGNSGGPVTNDAGEVLGVVDSMIAGSDIASVSFAIPALELGESLDRLGIPWSRAGAAESVPLAVSRIDEVQEAVALLHIPLANRLDSLLVLKFSGHREIELKAEKQNDRRAQVEEMFSSLRALQGSGKEDVNGFLVLSPRGEALYCSANELWPGSGLSMPELVFPPLPSGRQRSWQSTDQFLTQSQARKQQESPFGMFGPGFIGPGRSPRFGGIPGLLAPEPEPEPEPSVGMGSRTHNFSLPENGEGNTIRVESELTINGVNGAGSTTKETATGTITFDLDAGQLEKLDSTGTIEGMVEGQLKSMTTKTTVQRVERAVLEEEARIQAQRQAEFQAQMDQKQQAARETLEAWNDRLMAVESLRLDKFEPDK